MLAAATAADWGHLAAVVRGGRRLGERAQPTGGRRRRAGVAEQGGDVLRPHLAVLGLVAAIADVFCPKMLVCNNDASWVRFAVTAAGGTVAASAVS